MDINTPLLISFISYMNIPLFQSQSCIVTIMKIFWIPGALDFYLEQITECTFKDEFKIVWNDCRIIMSLKVHSEARIICWKLSLRLQVFKTKFLIFIFRVSGSYKHVGALLWYTEREVRHGNNQTCTSKPQKCHVPSKKQQDCMGVLY